MNNSIKGNLRAIRDKVLVSNMYFGEQTTKSGLILRDDDGTTRGIYPRWGQVYSKGPDNNEEYDILIEQNCKEKCWKILIGKELQTALSGAHFDRVFDFSITKKRNPNIFYRRLEFDMRQLISRGGLDFPFTDNFELDSTPISLYTNKKFDVYAYRKVEDEV